MASSDGGTPALLGRVNQGWAIVVATAVAGALLGLVISLVPSSAFTSEALIVVVPPQQQSTADGIPVASVWAEAAGTDAVLGPVAARLGTTLRELSDSTQISVADAAPLIVVSVTTHDAENAATWANELSAELVAEAEANSLSGFTLRALTTAVPATQPQGSLTLPMTAAGLVIGGLAGLWWSRRRTPHRS